MPRKTSIARFTTSNKVKLIKRGRRHHDGEKGSQCGENRKGCVMSFPYQCLATAILTSCPAGLTGICRLTPLPSPYATNTHTHTNSYTLCSPVKHTHKQVLTHLPGLSLSHSWIHTHASSKAGEVFPFCGPPALHILLFLSK